MKETKDDIVIKIESKSEAEEFKKIATGRRFFKVGERVIDICEQEIERYQYENSGFLNRLLHRSKFKNKKEQYLLESRIPSVIRSIAAYILRNNDEEDVILDGKELSKRVRAYLLSIVKKYNGKRVEHSKVIDIKTKTKKEA